MRFLVIAQDLRVSGTSEGVVSRSFIAKLRTAYPNSIIEILYLKNQPSEDQLHLLPVNKIETHVLNLKITFITALLNKFYWRLFHVSLKDRYVNRLYASYISKQKPEHYNTVFVRSSGLNHEAILACKDLPILKKAIINFHDPYPFFWYPGTKQDLTNLELFKIKDMRKIILQARGCMSPARMLSNDLAFLYGSRKKFYTLPHQYSSSVFDLSDTKEVLKKEKKVMISYHGAIMFGRNIDIILDAYSELIKENDQFQENTEFVVRLRGQDSKRLTEKYKYSTNIKVLPTLNFSNSCYEQVYETSINVILENGPLYSNTLVGKAPFLASIEKQVLILAPERSELRLYVKNEDFIASYDDPKEVKLKLENMINECLVSNKTIRPFGDYFTDTNFEKMLKKILNESTEM